MRNQLFFCASSCQVSRSRSQKTHHSCNLLLSGLSWRPLQWILTAPTGQRPMGRPPAACRASATSCRATDQQRCAPSISLLMTAPTRKIQFANLRQLFRRENAENATQAPHVLSIDYDDDGELLLTSASDETLQIYNVKEGRHEKSLVSKKYGVKLAKFTHTKSSIIYASTKQNSCVPSPSLSAMTGLDSLTPAGSRCYSIPSHTRQLLYPLLRGPRGQRHRHGRAPRQR